MRFAPIALAGLLLASTAEAGVSSPHPGLTLVDHGSTALVVADLCAPGVSVRATKYGERDHTAASWAQLVDAEVAINADFFDFPGWSYVVGRARGGGEDWPPGAQLKEVRSYWQFGLNFAGFEPNAAVPPAGAPWVTEIVGGHNILIQDGMGHGPFYDGDAVITTSHRRTAVGLSADRRHLYVFASDASLDGDGIVWNMAISAAEAGAPAIHWATNMDGGGSSQLYVKGLGAVISSSRPVNNHLGIYAKGVGPAWNCNCVPETCNGLDDDCDGLVDEDLSEQCGSDVGVCEFGTKTCDNGTWGECKGGVTPSLEKCNELDDDCDGTTDEDQVCEVEEAWQASLFDPGTLTDIDGDGRADVCGMSDQGVECHLANGHGFAPTAVVLSDVAEPESPSVFSTLRMGDVTGDGRADLCLRQPSGVVCWAGTAHGLGKRIAGPAFGDAEGYDDVAHFSTVRLGDIDGDGRLDLCARGALGFECHRSTGNGFGDVWLLPALSDAAGFDDVNRYGTLRLGDIDGDGRTDVCARDADGVSCWRAGPSGFSQRIVGPAWSDADGWNDWKRWSTIRLADVDGDGRADLCARDGEAFRCMLSDGSGFGREVSGPKLTDADGWGERDRFGSLRMGDVDGDERADLCGRTADGVRCWLFTGSGFDHVVTGPALGKDDGWNLPEGYRTLRLADVTADRRMDLCARTPNGIRCWVYQSGGFVESVAGPDWSNAAGWNAADRYNTVRIAGAGVSAPASAEPEASDEGGVLSGCALRRSGGGSAPVTLIFGFLLALAARRKNVWR
jgi:Phosphodiester glycosidase/FG-GAP-like repeat/Putative metal-binding motif